MMIDFELIDGIPVVADNASALQYAKEHPEYGGPIVYDKGFVGSSRPVQVGTDGMGFVSVADMDEDRETALKVSNILNGRKR